jgi:hypothetical protein
MADGKRFRRTISDTGLASGTGKKRLTARCRWHFGGGPDYCASCAEADLPCSRGEASSEGKFCPYAEQEPQTTEGWQIWDVALKSAGQLRMTQFAVIGLDFSASMKIAEALGYDLTAAANLLPACEDGMTAAINEKLAAGMKR